MVDPERDPGQHHDEDAGQVGLEHEVADVPPQLEAQRQPLIHARRQFLLEFFNGLPQEYLLTDITAMT